LSTLLTLFAGLLLFVVDRDGGLVIDPGLQNFLKFSLPVITILLIVFSNIVVISMFLFDAYIRRKKDKKKLKKKRKLEAEKMEIDRKMSAVLDDLRKKNES
jgi:membrane protein implicated in regulation of membrane protease activity